MRVFPCGCEFSTCPSLRQDEISSPQETWVRVFPCGCEFSTCTCLRHDEILSPQEMWVRVFPCGCEFSTCTCLRHDEILSPQRGASGVLVSIMPQGYDRLLLPQELADLVARDLHTAYRRQRQMCIRDRVRVFPCGCEFSTCTPLRHDEIVSPQRDLSLIHISEPTRPY